MKKGQTQTIDIIPLQAGGALQPTIYFRRDDRLSARDRADLEAYAEVLRPYYGIPEGEPVFPEQEDQPRSHQKQTGPADPSRTSQPKPRATGINGDNHPWRNTL